MKYTVNNESIEFESERDASSIEKAANLLMKHCSSLTKEEAESLCRTRTGRKLSGSSERINTEIAEKKLADAGIIHKFSR